MKTLFILILIAGLMIAGCTSTPPATGNNPTNGGNISNPPSNPPTNPPPSDNGTTPPSNPPANPPAGDDLAGKTYEELIGLGVPLKCSITVVQNGTTIKSTVYMKGKDTLRSEYTGASAGVCTTMVTIMKGDKAYIGCDGGSLFPDTGGAESPFSGCKWMEINVNKSTTTTASTGAASPPDYTTAPPADISCAPWIADDSKFVVDGKACNMQDIMKSYGSGGSYPVPPN
jgi:hypothetical protein